MNGGQCEINKVRMWKSTSEEENSLSKECKGMDSSEKVKRNVGGVYEEKGATKDVKWKSILCIEIERERKWRANELKRVGNEKSK